MRTHDGLYTMDFVGSDGEHVAGFFQLAGGRVTGIDRRRVRYSGRYEACDGRLALEIDAQVPVGAPVSHGLAVEQAFEHALDLELGADHLSGRETIALELPGFGHADVRFRRVD